jgi:N-acetylglutamate synthase-like GNAT family acetyltransferase
MTLIRPYTPADAKAVVDVILPIQQSEFGIPITLEGQPDLKDISGFYQREKGGFWVAESEGTVVGTIALLDIGNRQAALRKMFVSQSHRGPELGVARHLLATLLEWCRLRDIDEIYLGTTAAFLAAHRFYEKNGFTKLARTELPPTFPVMTVDTRFYVRRLGYEAGSTTTAVP